MLAFRFLDLLPAFRRLRLAAVAFLHLAAVFLALSCTNVSADTQQPACQVLGLCDEAPKPAEHVDVLCDPSVGSSCTRDRLGEVLDTVLAHVADKPGSAVRLWILGKDVGGTASVAEQVVPPAVRARGRAKEASAKRFEESARAFLLSAASASFQGPPVRRSPIAEALSKIALAEAAGVQRTSVAITDAREVGVSDFECGILPSEERFLARLKERGLLEPGSLSGVRVLFAFVRSEAIPSRGCPVEVQREARIRALWTAALEGAGAVEVRFGTGAPRLAPGSSEADNKKETP